jgi:hypothetical protein
MYRGRGEETGIYWTSVMANAVINRYAIMDTNSKVLYIKM